MSQQIFKNLKEQFLTKTTLQNSSLIESWSRYLLEILCLKHEM